MLGGLDGLVFYRNTAYSDDVGVDDAAGGAVIAVVDGPRLSIQPLGGRAAAGFVERLALDLAGAGVAAEYPQVAGPRVKVEIELLRRRSDADLGEV